MMDVTELTARIDSVEARLAELEFVQLTRMVKEIEERTGNPVYVGSIAGASGSAQWACVDIAIGRLQVPGETAIDAVRKLYLEVM